MPLNFPQIVERWAVLRLELESLHRRHHKCDRKRKSSDLATSVGRERDALDSSIQSEGKQDSTTDQMTSDVPQSLKKVQIQIEMRKCCSRRFHCQPGDYFQEEETRMMTLHQLVMAAMIYTG